MGEAGFRAMNIEVFERSFRKTLEEIMPHILERTVKIGAVYLGNIDYEMVMTDTDAAYSFVLGLFGATIFFASRAIEMAINKDGRMQERRMKSPREWLTLNRRVLKEARANGLPVDLLLNADEVRLECDPVFVLRRNKVVHGDTEGYKEATGFYRTIDFTEPYKLPVAPSEDEACDQLIKSRKFLIEWVKSGSTDVPKGARFVSR